LGCRGGKQASVGIPIGLDCERRVSGTGLTGTGARAVTPRFCATVLRRPVLLLATSQVPASRIPLIFRLERETPLAREG
jgi:hypothetical protein